MEVIAATRRFRNFDISFLIFAFLLAFWASGCASTGPAAPSSAETASEPTPGAVQSAPERLPSGYAPVEIAVLPLTELTDAANGQPGAQLNIYISLLDGYREKVKAPGVFRFELYEYVQRSSEPKGQRIAIWPDIDLTDPAQNQRYWRDFLRAYEFRLAAQASKSKTYILEVTCLRPGGKRLSTERSIKPQP